MRFISLIKFLEYLTERLAGYFFSVVGNAHGDVLSVSDYGDLDNTVVGRELDRVVQLRLCESAAS